MMAVIARKLPKKLHSLGPRISLQFNRPKLAITNTKTLFSRGILSFSLPTNVWNLLNLIKFFGETIYSVPETKTI